MKIVKKGCIDESIRNLSSDMFFSKLLERCMEEKILIDENLESIMYERMELLKEKLKYYTKDESSSIAVEEAEDILKGIDYTLGIYLKSLDEESLIDELKNKKLSCILSKGEKLIKDKFAINKILFKKIKMEKLKVNNYSYDDTIEYGLSVFFSKYDIFFKPHDTPCSIDYQLPLDIMQYKGIEYIEKYIKILSFENKFCSKFENEKLIRLLKNYDKKYEELLINIFELTLMNSLGRFMCGKDLFDLELTENDVLQIKYEYKNLNLSESFKIFNYALKMVLKELNIEDEELYKYAVYIIKRDFEFIYKTLKEKDNLGKVFIILSVKEEREVIKYVDGEKLADYKFRMYTEKIRESKSIEEKIEIISSNFKSLEDVVDMLHSDCLFSDEYYSYFNSMKDIQIVLLYKYFTDKNLEDENNEEWCNYFKNYIENLSEYKMEKMKEISQKIEFYA